MTRRFVAAVAAVALLLLLSVPALAHVHFSAGDYNVALGWANEPAYAGELNAVEVIVTDASDNPVTDIGPDDLQVVVSATGQTSQPLTFEPAFDADEGTGMLGDYRAPIIPTDPGDYTFHLTGTIHGQAIDQTATSSDSTFATVVAPTEIQFPNQLPTSDELATRIEQVDSRSSSSAQSALLIGAGIGLVGVVIGLAALAIALRGRHSARSA